MQIIDHRPRFSYRELPSHQFMPMLGVNICFQQMFLVATLLKNIAETGVMPYEQTC
jgi:hypothetical protein